MMYLNIQHEFDLLWKLDRHDGDAVKIYENIGKIACGQNAWHCSFAETRSLYVSFWFLMCLSSCSCLYGILVSASEQLFRKDVRHTKDENSDSCWFAANPRNTAGPPCWNPVQRWTSTAPLRGDGISASEGLFRKLARQDGRNTKKDK